MTWVMNSWRVSSIDARAICSGLQGLAGSSSRLKDLQSRDKVPGSLSTWGAWGHIIDSLATTTSTRHLKSKTVGHRILRPSSGAKLALLSDDT